MVLIQSVSSLSIRQQRSDTAEMLSSSFSDVGPNRGPFRVEESDLTKSFAGNSRSIESDYSDLDGPPRKNAWFKRTVQVASSVMECYLGTIRAESNTQLQISTDMDDLMLHHEKDQGEDETSYTVYPAAWLIRLGIRYGFRLKFGSSATQGWRTTLKAFCPVPDDALIFEFCKQGNTSAARALLSGGYASVRDTDSEGYTPLHVSLLRHKPLSYARVSNARVKFAAQNHHPELCEILKSAGADINALTYSRIARTPMLLASTTYYTTYATLSDVSDTLRLLTDSMDFLDENASGWMVLDFLCDSTTCIGGETEAKSALLLWMLKLFTYELKAYYIRSSFTHLFRCTLSPAIGLEQATDLLLKLGDAKIIDVQDGTDGYTVLHKCVAYAEGLKGLNRVLAKGPNLHLLGFDEMLTPEKESPLSLAMYSSWAFEDWLDGLVAIEVDLSTFIDQELESNALVHPGWDQETLRDLFEYHARPDPFLRRLWACSDCDRRDIFPGVRVQPYWRHLLERIKQRIDPDDPFGSDSGVDEMQIPDSRSEVEGSKDSGHEPEISRTVPLDDSNDEVWSESEFESELELGHDVHGYPETVSIRSDCVYDEEDVVCMDCWLHYRRMGYRFRAADASVDEYSSSEDESSDDEFSPYLIHS